MTALQKIFQGYYEERLGKEDSEGIAIAHKKIVRLLSGCAQKNEQEDILFNVAQYGAAAEETGFMAGFQMAWELLQNLQQDSIG